MRRIPYLTARQPLNWKQIGVNTFDEADLIDPNGIISGAVSDLGNGAIRYPVSVSGGFNALNNMALFPFDVPAGLIDQGSETFLLRRLHVHVEFSALPPGSYFASLAITETDPVDEGAYTGLGLNDSSNFLIAVAGTDTGGVFRNMASTDGGLADGFIDIGGQFEGITNRIGFLNAASYVALNTNQDLEPASTSKILVTADKAKYKLPNGS